MLEKVTIVRTSLKEGMTKDNKPYVKIGIRTDKHGETWLGCFLNQFNTDKLTKLKEGDVVTILTEKSGDFTNFKLPGKTDLLEARVEVLETQIKQLLGPTANTSPSAAPEYTEADINPDDIPF